MRTAKFSFALFALFIQLKSIQCHMQLQVPLPIRSPLDPENAGGLIDYDYTSPLNGANFPCKGYQNDQPVRIKALYTAGQVYNVTFAPGGATHGGGSCQLSLSYDNGATFRVIKSIIGGCPLQSAYNFTVPSYAPSGNALFAWTWYNKIGNREIYMDCAQVQIVASSTARRSVDRRQSTFNSMDSLPYVWKANLPDVSNCTTIEGQDPVFPNPGPDVEYGDGFSSTSPATSGSCDSPTPAGAAYRDLANETPAASGAETSSATRSSGFATNVSPLNSPSSTSTVQGSPIPYVSSAARAYYALSPATSTSDCDSVMIETLTVTANPSTSTVCPDVVYITSTAATSTVYHTATASSVPSSAPSTSNSQMPPYAGSDTSAYLPCQPGTFICNTVTTFSTCLGSGTSYQLMGSVAGGMMCMPFLSPSTYGSPGYREDRIVRAQPLGSCTTEGQILCTNQGAGFAICDQGGWVVMGSVAPGTQCVGSPGYITYSS